MPEIAAVEVEIVPVRELPRPAQIGVKARTGRGAPV